MSLSVALLSLSYHFPEILFLAGHFHFAKFPPSRPIKMWCALIRLVNFAFKGTYLIDPPLPVPYNKIQQWLKSRLIDDKIVVNAIYIYLSYQSP